MHFLLALRILGLLLMVFSATMIPPILIDLIYQDGMYAPFGLSFLLTFFTGLIVWFTTRHSKRELRMRDGFLVVVMFWAGLGLFGALPLWLADAAQLSVTDAIFESISGLTTTGATVITGLDTLPKALLFYRQLLQWLGGMGIIVLAVAVLPMLGIGGMQLYRCETPGPVKDSKLTPRITETAKALWYIYLSLTIACSLAYWLAGMNAFDAISHAFATVAIGGFSTHDDSMGYFNSPLIEMIAVVFMFIAGVNFALHFMAWRRAAIGLYWKDPEFKVYCIYLGISALLTCIILLVTNYFDDASKALHHGLFQAVSIGTTAGFTTTDYQSWPIFLPVLLLFSSFVGGCAGSTGGGIKVIRIVMLFKQGSRELKRLIHPNGVFPIKVGRKALPDRVIDAVWGFFAAYVVVFAIMLLLLMASGLDQITAFSAVAACLNNLGPGLGDVAAHYGDINDFSKWVLCLAMLLGRLEIFTLLVLFTPAFWRS